MFIVCNLRGRGDGDCNVLIKSEMTGQEYSGYYCDGSEGVESGVSRRGYDGAAGGRQVCSLMSLMALAHPSSQTRTASGQLCSVSLFLTTIRLFLFLCLCKFNTNIFMGEFHYELLEAIHFSYM